MKNQSGIYILTHEDQKTFSVSNLPKHETIEYHLKRVFDRETIIKKYIDDGQLNLFER